MIWYEFPSYLIKCKIYKVYVYVFQAEFATTCHIDKLHSWEFTEWQHLAKFLLTQVSGHAVVGVARILWLIKYT